MQLQSWQGKHGNLYWTYHAGVQTPRDWVVYTKHFVEAMKVGGYFLGVSRGDSVPTPRDRAMMIDAYNNAEGMVKGHAILIEKLVFRCVATAINFFIKKPFPEMVHSDPFRAIEWIAGLHGEKPVMQDARSVWRSIIKEIPPEFRWPDRHCQESP